MALVRRAADTAFGRAHDFASIRSIEDYQRRVPLMNYGAFWDNWWEPAFPNLNNITWPGRIGYFANTSGTTGAATKRIPLSAEMLRGNRDAALDVLAFHFHLRPESRVLGGKSIFLAGSTALEELAPGICAGDLSAIAAIKRPIWARGRVLPPDDIARIPDWQRKMEALARAALSAAPDVKSISGTTSWMLLFFETAAAMRPPGARLRDLFPALELIVHGGVAFAPYRDRFAYWMEGSRATTREVYPASEGFIAAADRSDGEGLRLMLDHGLFYEFVLPEELGAANAERRWIGNAELNREYALVLSTNAGLWSYVIGDTVRLISRDRLLVTGRTAWSLSVAGEHLVGSELDAAMSEAARTVGRNVVDYSAAPLHPDGRDARSGHFFAVELDGPADAAQFGNALDVTLRRLNHDYAAHRAAGFGLRDPVVQLLPPGSFARWMATRGKLGAQNKVPRVVASLDKLAGLLPNNLS